MGRLEQPIEVTPARQADPAGMALVPLRGTEAWDAFVEEVAALGGLGGGADEVKQVAAEYARRELSESGKEMNDG